VSLPIAILAGGLATRLRPVTKTVPKALVSVNGEPFVNHQLRLLARNEIKRVVFLVGYLGEQIIDIVGGGAQFGLDVEFVFDGPHLLGTGGAVAKACPQLGDAFFVLYGDSYLDCDYQTTADQFHESGKPALMTVFKNEGRWDTSNVEYEEGKIIQYSKAARTPRMNYIDYGLGLFRKSVFDEVPKDIATDLSEIYCDLAEDGQLAAQRISQRFYEVGSFSGIRELEEHLDGISKNDVH